MHSALGTLQLNISIMHVLWFILRLSFRREVSSWAERCALIVPATWEAEVRGSLEPWRSSPAWETQQDLIANKQTNKEVNKSRFHGIGKQRFEVCA